MIDYIDIKGYKSIKDQHIELKPINILIGSNGSGKSNFLSFFEFLEVIYRRRLSEYHKDKGTNFLLHKGLKVTDTISFEIQFDNGQNGYYIQMRMGEQGFIITDERLIYNGDKGSQQARSNYEANISTTDNYRAKYVKNYLQGLKKYHFHETDTKSPLRVNESNANAEYSFLSKDGHNLAAFLYNIRENFPKHYNRIVYNIQSVAPFFNDFILEPNPKTDLIKLRWQDKYSDTVYDSNSLSDGTLRFIALATLFLQPNLPNTIIIDEPELGLHPFAIAKLAGMIKGVSTKSQVIVATQSTDLISHFNPEDIITVDQRNGETEFIRLDPNIYEDWLKEYTIDDLWKRNIISNGQPNY